MTNSSGISKAARRLAVELDAIGGISPMHVVSPANILELENTFREITQARTHAVLTGNRSKIEWGLPPRIFDLGINMKAMPEIIEHEASDLVVRVSSNVTLDRLQAQLHQRRQRLAVDTVVPNTTIGGMIATGISGPLRYGFGAVRDLIIGATVVRPDGVRATTGGRVVKNVAGYDLAKLYTGSFGTLGAITEAFFRLHSLPEAAHFLIFEVSLHEVFSISQSILYTQMAPSAFEVHDTCDGSDLQLGVLLEGSEASIRERTSSMSKSLAREPQLLTESPDWWGVLPGDTTFKVTLEVASAQKFLEQIHEIGASSGQSLLVTGSIGTGALYIGAPKLGTAAESEIDAITLRIRAAATLSGGACVVIQSPERVRNSGDVWGAIPSLDVMKRIKAQFDPLNLLSPGRFVGGI